MLKGLVGKAGSPEPAGSACRVPGKSVGEPPSSPAAFPPGRPPSGGARIGGVVVATVPSSFACPTLEPAGLWPFRPVTPPNAPAERA